MKEEKDAVPKDSNSLKRCLESTVVVELGKGIEDSLQLLANRTKGYLSIGGSSIQEIMLV